MIAARLPVLLYHHIGPIRDGTYPSLTVTPEKFELQMRWLARRGYIGVRARDCFPWKQSNDVFAKKPVILTFDDAYSDLANFALPTLRRLKFSCVVFVVTGQIGGTNAWDTARGSGPHELMSSSQIREWAANGIEFGAHGRTHVDLTTLNPISLSSEVRESALDLADLLGVQIPSFAYPYGASNDAVRNCVKEYFEFAFTAEEGLNRPETDRFQLRRSMVSTSDTLLDLSCRVQLGWSPFMALRSRLRLRSRGKALLSCLRFLQNRDA
jgi:peptidoglycan/xylan/chitin deacetylase (PgdA/CDA1 family)